MLSVTCLYRMEIDILHCWSIYYLTIVCQSTTKPALFICQLSHLSAIRFPWRCSTWIDSYYL